MDLDGEPIMTLGSLGTHKITSTTSIEEALGTLASQGMCMQPDGETVEEPICCEMRKKGILN